jgi:Uma2 family endonuclease
VWLADPRRRDVLVYRSLTDVQRFTLDDTLSNSTALPGFTVSIAELFESLV